MPLPQAKSNSLFSNSFYIFIIRLFPSLANLVVLIWYSRALPQEAYGNYQHFWIQMNVIYPLICFGIHVVLITYSRDLVLAIMQRIKAMHYFMYTLWAVALSALFAWLQTGIPGISFIVPMLFMLSFSLSMILESMLIVSRRYIALTITSLSYAIAFCAVHAYVLHNGFSLQAIFSALLLTSAMRFLVYLVLFVQEMKRENAITVVDDALMSKIRSLWLHLGLYDVLQILFSWVDKFTISIVLIAPLSAIYYNGSQTIPVLPLLLSAAGSAVLLRLAEGNIEDETTSIAHLMNRSGKLLSCIVFPVFLYLYLFRTELFMTVFTEKYREAVPIFSMSILVLPLKSYSFTTALQRLHKGNVINAGAIADLLLACALMYPLFLWKGLPGVALSFVITTYLQAVFYLVYTARLLKVNPLQLVPYANWAIKMVVFASIFIAIRYTGGRFFNTQFALILGGAGMLAMMAASLLAEIKDQGKHGSN